MKKKELMALLANYEDNEEIDLNNITGGNLTIDQFMKSHATNTRYTVWRNGDILGTLIKGNGTIDAFNRYVCELSLKVVKFESFGKNFIITVEA